MTAASPAALIAATKEQQALLDRVNTILAVSGATARQIAHAAANRAAQGARAEIGQMNDNQYGKDKTV